MGIIKRQGDEIMEHIEIEERSYLQNIQKTKEVIQKLKAMARHYEISFQEEDSRMDTFK